MPAGELRERVAFDARLEIEDGYGNEEGDFAERIAGVAARIQPLKGGERVLADRLTGVQPFVIRVRYSAMAAAIDPGWRARNLRTGDVYAITAAANMDETRRYLDILATRGEAA